MWQLWYHSQPGYGPGYRKMISGYRLTAPDVVTSVNATGDTVVVRVLAYETTGTVESFEFQYKVHHGKITWGRSDLLATSYPQTSPPAGRLVPEAPPDRQRTAASERLAVGQPPLPEQGAIKPRLGLTPFGSLSLYAKLCSSSVFDPEKCRTLPALEKSSTVLFGRPPEQRYTGTLSYSMVSYSVARPVSSSHLGVVPYERQCRSA